MNIRVVAAYIALISAVWAVWTTDLMMMLFAIFVMVGQIFWTLNGES